jgi:hypothetical protein
MLTQAGPFQKVERFGLNQRCQDRKRRLVKVHLMLFIVMALLTSRGGWISAAASSAGCSQVDLPHFTDNVGIVICSHMFI